MGGAWRPGQAQSFEQVHQPKRKSPMRRRAQKPLKGLFIGVDGATDDVIGPMISQGRLPHLARLKKQGAYGRLKSQPGYSSPALWTTIESGYPTEEHGILGFGTALRPNLRKRRIHEHLAGAGWKVGMCRMFCNWPPGENEVFVVPSFADVSDKAYPEWVSPLCQGKQIAGVSQKVAFLYRLARARLGLATLSGVIRAGLTAPHAAEDDHEAYYLVQKAQHCLYCRLFRRLVTEFQPEYAAVLIGIADSVGHRYWHYHHAMKNGDCSKPVRCLGGIVEAAYAEIDKAVGEFMDLTDDRTVIMVVSDHGMELVRRTGHNLIPKSSIPKALRLPKDTEGYFSGMYAFLAPEDDRTSLTELLSKLRQTRLAKTAEPLFAPCRLSGKRVVFGFSTNIDWNPKATVLTWSGRRVPLEELARREPRRSGDHGHGPDGIWLLKGPGVRPGVQMSDPTRYEVAPTLLALLGMPVPKKLPGYPCREALMPEVDDGIRYTDEDASIGSEAPAPMSNEDEAVLEERLRDLGYVD